MEKAKTASPIESNQKAFFNTVKDPRMPIAIVLLCMGKSLGRHIERCFIAVEQSGGMPGYQEKTTFLRHSLKIPKMTGDFNNETIDPIGL